jgi:hypothetical protein
LTFHLGFIFFHVYIIVVLLSLFLCQVSIGIGYFLYLRRTNRMIQSVR